MVSRLLRNDYYKNYLSTSPFNWEQVIVAFSAAREPSAQDFEYYIAASSLYSSKIEGNSLDINSFMRGRMSPGINKPKEVQEIEDLMDAYRFASKSGLNYDNFLTAHGLLTQTILDKKEQGVIRTNQVGVFDSVSGRPVYLAVEPEYVGAELKKLFEDVAELLAMRLSVAEQFYYASLLHLWAAMIHPFSDGNGRAARLLEKWFLSKNNKNIWGINTEKYYWDNRPDYYKTINLGYNYYALHWERCIPFLHMLPLAVLNNQ